MCSYKIRCFYSKGAFMIIFGTLLSSTSLSYLSYVLLFILSIINTNEAAKYSGLILVPAVPLVVIAPIVGWIADSRCGNYKVVRVGVIVFLISTIMACVCSLLLQNVFTTCSSLVKYAIIGIVCTTALAGVTACFVTGLQLGLDQMPDASSSNITSFITWFVLAIVLGVWSLKIWKIVYNCSVVSSHLNSSWIPQIFSLVPVFLMSIVCCALFLLGQKWLIIEPNCPQSLKTIYQVLKFAWKHTSPLNRSALTYWEEDIPSRMDLGKSRYGGPFTTEQVEDVKTFFKILIIFLPLFLTSCSFYPLSIVMLTKSIKFDCNSVYSLLYSLSTVMAIAMLMYEFVFFPLFRNRLPNILKRIEIISLSAFIFNAIELTMTVTFSYYPTYASPWYKLIYFIPSSCSFVFLFTALLEFVCAQSPYKMRGLLLGYVFFLYIISIGINVAAVFLCHKYSSSKSTLPKYILYSVFTVVSLVAFVVYCLLARWYKMRVRDEEYNVHRVVEEVYDRYLSHTCR